jgi:hypothetical protein
MNYLLPLLMGVLLVPTAVSAAEHRLIADRELEEVSLSEIVEFFIALGIIEGEKVAQAREAVARLAGGEDTMDDAAISVRASVLIEHGDRRYEVGEDIEGLILLITNESDETQWISSNPNCRILYTIYDEPDDPVYTNRDTRACTQEGLTQFALAPGDVQIFEVTHEQDTFPLWRDDYLVRMDYLNYGGGVVWIEVGE